MFRSSVSMVLLCLGVAFVAGACGGSVSGTDSPEEGSGGDGAVGGGAATTGGQKSGGTGGALATGGRASGGAALSGGGGRLGGQGGAGGEGEEGVQAPTLIEDPDRDATGPGNCSMTTLGEFIESVHQLMPELADIDFLAPPDILGGPEREILALSSAGGFAVAFKRGSGDCPAGCINETFWYFEADRECQPIFVGSYSAIYNSGDNCYDVEGLPSWGIGREVQVASRCGFDPTANHIAGTYSPGATGLASRCPEAKNASWEGPFEFIVVQDPNDLAKAEVEFKSVHPELDGQTWPAEVTANEVRVNFTRAKSSCIDSMEVQLDFDVASGSGRFHLFEVRSNDCQDSSADYCKGSMDLTLE